MKSQSERKSDLKALKLKYPSSTQSPNLKNPVKLSSPSSVDEVGARTAPGSRGLGLARGPWVVLPLGRPAPGASARPLGRAAPRSRIWWLRPGHLVGFFSSSASFFFFFLAPGFDVCVVVLISLLVLVFYLVRNRVSKT